MTEGQRMVWAARYERVQSEYMGEALARWHSNRREGDPKEVPREVASGIGVESIRVAVQQANAAVFSLSIVPPPAGQEGAMLREMLGIAEPLRLALPDGFPEPMDYSMPPPGWMFPEGCNDSVHSIPPDALLTCTPAVDRQRMVVVYPAVGDVPLKPLAQAWREHMEANDPPGYTIASKDNGSHQPVSSLMVAGAKIAGFSDQGSARAIAWRCLERPGHVNFAMKLGRYVERTLLTILDWSETQLAEAMAYVQAMSSWEAGRPAAPEFL